MVQFPFPAREKMSKIDMPPVKVNWYDLDRNEQRRFYWSYLIRKCSIRLKASTFKFENSPLVSFMLCRSK
jgi:hypothetical protein